MLQGMALMAGSATDRACCVGGVESRLCGSPLAAQVLFCPSDIGLNQAGVAEAVVQAVQAAHPALQPLLYTNVVLTGGSVGARAAAAAAAASHGVCFGHSHGVCFSHSH